MAVAHGLPVDVVIVGGGIVGAAAALVAAQQGLHVVLLERSRPEMVNQASLGLGASPPPWDSRIYALSPSNQAFIAHLGAWSPALAHRSQAVRQMVIAGDAEGASLVLDAAALPAPAMAWMIENRGLQAALWQQIAMQPLIRLVVDDAPVAISYKQESVALRLASGLSLDAAILIGADGVNSWVRTHAGMGVKTHDFAQMGVVMNLRPERAHQGIAYQWFLGDKAGGAVLAYLPLADGAISVVWSLPTDTAKAYLALRPQILADKIAAAGHHTLGTLTPLNAAQGFPLASRQTTGHAKRVLLFGDAAHTVHPLAGQGMNLGLRDVRAWADLLATRRAEDDLGSETWRHAYAQSRFRDQQETQTLTKGLYALFAHRAPLVAWLRHRGLSVLNQQAWLKKQLIRAAVG